MDHYNFPFLKSIYILTVTTLLTACAAKTESLRKTDVPPEFREGLHYRLVTTQPANRQNNDHVEVTEMFFYACPHCYALEKKIQNWLKDKEDLVEFKRIPAILGPTWADQAKAYYVAEKLGALEKIHPALLKAIHEDKRRFYDEYSVMEFFVEQGIDKQSFIEAYNSPEVADKVSQARIMTVRYSLRGVPAIVINGKYKTAPFYMGSQEKMMQVVDYLIEKERGSP
ncbi:MAG: thiol:disulfide interchange protein DsbA/DsbL [Gammaproteobacteria bacterium]